MSNLEQTLSIIKPDAVERNLENEIKAIYQQWFDFEESFYKDGWVCINGIKVK